MIVNVCASSISREPSVHTTLYSTYYYTEKRASTKSNNTVIKRKHPHKQALATEALLPKFEPKWKKLFRKLRTLVVSKLAKFA